MHSALHKVTEKCTLVDGSFVIYALHLTVLKSLNQEPDEPGI
jgi:hypothetical protein